MLLSLTVSECNVILSSLPPTAETFQIIDKIMKEDNGSSELHGLGDELCCCCWKGASRGRQGDSLLQSDLVWTAEPTSRAVQRTRNYSEKRMQI